MDLFKKEQLEKAQQNGIHTESQWKKLNQTTYQDRAKRRVKSRTIMTR